MKKINLVDEVFSLNEFEKATKSGNYPLVLVLDSIENEVYELMKKSDNITVSTFSEIKKLYRANDSENGLNYYFINPKLLKNQITNKKIVVKKMIFKDQTTAYVESAYKVIGNMNWYKFTMYRDLTSFLFGRSEEIDILAKCCETLGEYKNLNKENPSKIIKL